MLAAVLALTSSAAWGTGDFFGGLVSRRRHVLAVLVISQGTGLVLIGALLAIRGIDASAGPRLWFAAIAGTVGVIGLGAFYRGLAIGAMGVVAPISGTAAAIPVVVGLVLGERPGPIQWAGIVIAIIGVVLVARESTPERDAETGDRPPIAAGVGLALIAAVGFGAFLALMGFAADPDPLLATLVSRSASVSMLVLVALLIRPDMRVGRGDGALIVMVGCFDLTANAIYAIATTLGLLSVVSVLGSLYPMITVLLAAIFLHERISLHQRVGSALAIGGAVMLAAGGA
ncbi:MAG: hypothetical protein QOG62_1169 [Thermoleophilaceae bacterium]|nr:hypothetical protein [Thermoleophilaceae bacterium]